MERITVNDICEVFVKRTGIDFTCEKGLRKEKLFGMKLKVKPRELLQVYMDLKNKLEITFIENDMINKKFSSFDEIIKLVEKTCGYSIE